MNRRTTEMVRILKRFALLCGIGTVLLSGYFSWDGLDQTITGANPGYTELTSIIGVVMVIVITLLQFVFNTDFNSLSPTLKFLGGLSYVYSIYTNKLGLAHLFGFNEFTSWMIAGFMDIVPEALIAWALDESLQGDFLGNLLKWVVGTSDTPKPKFRDLPPDNPPGKAKLSQPSFRFESQIPKGKQNNMSKFHPVGKKDDPNETKPKFRGGFE